MILRFDPRAKQKMLKLVDENSTEVGWYGVCDRSKDSVIVRDILEYPQIKGPASVKHAGEAYDKWMLSIPDSIANKIRFAGHSHVNMAAIPSQIDYADELLTIDQLGDDDYYVFMIINKRGEYDCRYYDGVTKSFAERRGLIA